MSYIGLSAVLDVISSLCLFFDVRVLGAAQDFLERYFLPKGAPPNQEAGSEFVAQFITICWISVHIL